MHIFAAPDAGWGWSDDQNLEVIAEAVREGAELTHDQRVAWRSRRMRTSAPNGIWFGGLVVARMCVKGSAVRLR